MQQGAFEVSVQLLGRLTDPAQFGDVLLKSGPDGRLVETYPVESVDEREDGSLLLRLCVCNDQPLRSWILSFGAVPWSWIWQAERRTDG